MRAVCGIISQVMKRFWNIPNILTLLRFLAVPIYWIMFFTESTYIPALFVFITAIFTDVADGIIARKLNMVTKYGKVLDPLADKLIQVSALTTLVIAGRLMWLFSVIILVKELYLIVCGSILFKRKVVVCSNYIGKIATVVMCIGIILIMFDVTLEIGRYITAAGIGVSLISAVNYTIVTLRRFDGKIPSSDNQEEINIKY